MTTNAKIFSIDGKGLKLDTREDIAPILKDVNPEVIEEIHFGGNTIGVEASLALAEFLTKTKSLKVHQHMFTRIESSKILVHTDRRLCRHLHRSSNRRNPPGSLRHLRRVERQDNANRD